MVISHKRPICEPCTLEVYVVVWLWIKNLLRKVNPLLLNFLSDNERHQAERKIQSAVFDNPIMVVAIHPVT